MLFSNHLPSSNSFLFVERAGCGSQPPPSFAIFLCVQKLVVNTKHSDCKCSYFSIHTTRQNGKLTQICDLDTNGWTVFQESEINLRLLVIIVHGNVDQKANDFSAFTFYICSYMLLAVRILIFHSPEMTSKQERCRTENS